MALLPRQRKRPWGVSSRALVFGVMVGAAGFELATLWSQTRCATRLRYAPTKNRIVGASAERGHERGHERSRVRGGERRLAWFTSIFTP